MPGRAQRARTPPAAIAVAHQLGIVARRRSGAGLSAFGGVKRRFTHTGTWNGVDIFDDYGHHPVEIAAVLKAARRCHVQAASSPSSSRTATPGSATSSTTSAPASTMPTPSSSPPVYAAGEAPIEGVDQRCAGRAHAAPRPSRRRGRWPVPRAAAPAWSARPSGPAIPSSASAPARSAPWAYALPRNWPKRRGCNGCMLRATIDTWPARAAALTPNAEIAPSSPGSASAAGRSFCSSPTDAEDLALFLSAARPDRSRSIVIGVGSNLLVRDGGIPGVVIRLSAKGFGRGGAVTAKRIHAEGRRFPTSALAGLCPRRGRRRLRISSTASPATIGGALRHERRRQRRETRERLVEAQRASIARASATRSRIADMGFTYRHSAAPET